MRKLKNLTEDEEIEVFEERKSGLKRKDILDKWGISMRSYTNIMSKFGVVTRWRYFNIDYFEKIDTEDKAYFLGFIIADGAISNNSNNISIIQKDPYILYEFKKYIEFSGDIYLPYKDRNVCTINFSSSKTKNDLSKLGVFPNKTYTIKYPDIPEELQNHFIRGVFDGDGCISLRKDKDGHQRGQFNICSGSYDFIVEYYNRLVNYCGLSGNNKIRNPKGSYYVVDWGGMSDIEKIYDFLYKDASVFLPRKKETFDKVVDITKNKLKYRK